MIKTSDLLVAPGQENILQASLAPLFNVMDFGVLEPTSSQVNLAPSFVFPGDDTVFGFATTSVSTSVSATDGVNAQGESIRTSQELKTTTNRELLSFSISGFTDLTGFSENRISLGSSALFVDFSNISVTSVSELLLSITFSEDESIEVIGESIEVIDQALFERSAVSVGAPIAINVLMLIAVLAVSIRKRRNI
ncbi:hypothetical protein [Alteromonas sp. KUL49]|uniref:hypothetical protein n=1 Tax=Alteromonas sp. KUL49 TaxID=2480798 RepID=UPI00102EE093|nr:hypothetical protein [Alteromonas sp. KUL49]TAP39201.1 hypothetical protein EYS00_11670 [Alteromonas sp. KUL49]GEA11975.1 hypothetical protein KUL49_23500 [Alteromonas sp. KUL49]